MLQLLDVVEQGRKHASQRVWQVCVIEVHDRLSGGRVQAATLNDPAGDPYDCGMRGHRGNPHRVKPGVSEHYLPDRTHRRVALEYYPNLFFDLLPQHKQLPLARRRTGETGKERSGELVFESPSR